MTWQTILAPSSKMDGYLRLFAAVALIGWNIAISTHLHTPYPAELIDMYAIPVTRLLLLILVLLAAAWCPTVGILAALAYVTLGADTLALTIPGN